MKIIVTVTTQAGTVISVETCVDVYLSIVARPSKTPEMIGAGTLNDALEAFAALIRREVLLER